MFYDCDGLTSITIGNGVTSIGWGAFQGCDNLKDVHIKDIAKWCKIAFHEYDSNPLYYTTNLYVNDVLTTNLVIPNGVTDICTGAFWGCDTLTSIVIPDSVTSIGDVAFSGCSNLKRVTISDSVKNIGDYAFYVCDSLTTVEYGGSKADWEEINIGVLNENLTNATIHYGRYDPITPAVLTVTPSGSGYALTADTDYNGVAYAATYDAGGVLLNVVSEPFVGGAATVAPSIAGAAKIKFFVWTNTVQPLTDAVTKIL